jgi:hypothetical protein
MQFLETSREIISLYSKLSVKNPQDWNQFLTYVAENPEKQGTIMAKRTNKEKN